MAYSDTITEATGVTNPSHLIIIEDCMRDIIFHSTLDWQDRETFKKGAREALEVCVAMGDIPKPTDAAPCIHTAYVTFGGQNYPHGVDRGPYCPNCDDLVEL